MIGRVSGNLIERHEVAHNALITVAVSGLGFEIHVPRSDIDGLSLGDEIILFTDLIVREDAMVLYGFSTSARRTLFRMLQTVTGVGPKVALTALSTTATEELTGAIVDGDIAFLERIPGIGKKVASRISLELREKMALARGGGARSARADVLSALINLGYGEKEAHAAVVDIGTDLGIEAALKEALTRLNRTQRS